MTGNKAIILAAGKGTRMRSQLPKVLHSVDGKPMIAHSVDRARAAGLEDITVVVGYGRELIMDALADKGVSFAVQSEQLGTGHAVMCAKSELEGFAGDVVVLYGDMPLLSSATIASLVTARRDHDAAGVALTMELPTPPDFGRIVRDANGNVCRVVEVADATPQELAIREVNVGAYCFRAPLLLDALGRLRADNQQSEYYLTDVLTILAGDGRRVESVLTPNLEDALGVNDLVHLAFAEKLGDIEYAESLYELVDAAAAMGRTK